MTSFSHLIIEIIESAYQPLSQIEQTELHHKPDPDRWSKKELIGHLIDSAYNNHQRFLRASSQDNLIFWGYDQDAWVQLNDYQQRSSEEILVLWSSANLHLARLINQLPQDILSRTTTEHNFDKICMNRLASGETTSLSYLIWDYIFHLEHHLAQLIPSYERRLLEYVHYS